MASIIQNLQMWKICQAFRLQYRSFVADSQEVPRQNSQTNLACLFSEVGILYIELKKKFFLIDKEASPGARLLCVRRGGLLIGRRTF